MNSLKRPLLVLMHAGAEISWIYACAAFTTVAVVGRSLPFGAALACFAAAAIVAHFSFDRGLRKGTVLLVQVAGLAAVAVAVSHAIYCPSLPLLSVEWLCSLFGASRPALQKVEIVFMLLSVLLVWYCGICLARREMTYRRLCGRFDMGLAFLFCLLLMKLTIAFKGGTLAFTTPVLYHAFSFLLLGLLAIVVSRSGKAGSKGFLEGYGLAALVVGLASVVLLLVAGLVLFFLPVLNKAAEVGYEVTKIGAGVVVPFFVTIMRFLFAPRKMLEEPASPSPKSTGLEHAFAPGTWWSRYIEPGMEWVLKGFFGAVLLFAACLLIYFIVMWLMGRTRAVERRPRPAWDPLSWLFRLYAALLRLFATIGRRLRPRRNVGEFYEGLMEWGRRSGLPAAPTDTPSEFGARLAHHFPMLANRIDSIVAAFNRETYGEAALSAAQCTGIGRDLRAMGHCRHWPARLKTRITGAGFYRRIRM